MYYIKASNNLDIEIDTEHKIVMLKIKDLRHGQQHLYLEGYNQIKDLANVLNAAIQEIRNQGPQPVFTDKDLEELYSIDRGE